MIQGTRQACLALEALHEFRILRVAGTDQLDGDITHEPSIGRPVNHTHATGTEHSHNLWWPTRCQP